MRKEWKENLKNQGSIQTEQEKKAEVRKCGTSAVLVCLQTEITAKQILSIIEKNYKNACQRLLAFKNLEWLINGLRLDTRTDPLSNYELQVVVDVAASLEYGLKRGNTIIKNHYLQGITSCDATLEKTIRVTFFRIL